jgi:hypothetical protein
MNTFCQNIPTNEDNVPIMTYHNLVATNTSGVNFKFSINGASPSNPNSNDLYDALVYSKYSTTISPAINPVWDPNFYGYFNIGAYEYYTLLRIPEFWNKGFYNGNIPIIFLAQNVIGAQFYNGYSWDNVNNKVLVTQNLTDDIIEDHIDNQTAYIVVIGFDELVDGTTEGISNSSCEGTYSCFDQYCDAFCGEPESCLDCQSQTNKKLYLEQIRIDTDERVSKGGTQYVIDNHFVDNLGGQYKLNLYSIVHHANNKYTSIEGGSIRPRWSQHEVVRKRYRNNGSVRGNGGTATWKTPWLRGNAIEEKDKKGILLCENFNPYKAKIYITISENDNSFAIKRYFFAPNSLPLNPFWKSQAMPTLCGPNKSSFFRDNTQNPSIFTTSDCMTEILPSQWLNSNGTLTDHIEISSTNVTFKLKYY